MRSSPEQKLPNPIDAGDFSLMVGGPLYQLLLKTRLARPPLALAHRRMLLFAAAAWLPLLVLSLMEGRALGGVAVPFLGDVTAYARFLVAIPLLVVAELTVHRALQPIIRDFRNRGLVNGASVSRFDAAIDAALRLSNSTTAEIGILILVYVLAPWLWKHDLALHADTWYAIVDGEGIKTTSAGWWLVFVSGPIFQFLLLRWYFRLVIWWRLLWQISRLPLELKALHPDRAGGIGFLADSVTGFIPFSFAHGVVVSGIIFSRVLTEVKTVNDFVGEILLLVVFLVALIVVPLLFFSPVLIAARFAAIDRLELLATSYAHAFEDKWLRSDPPVGETLLGNADIQSLADLASSCEIVRTMRPVPFNPKLLLGTIIVVLLPFTPLVLTAIPFGELVKRVVTMLF